MRITFDPEQKTGSAVAYSAPDEMLIEYMQNNQDHISASSGNRITAQTSK